MNLFAKALNAMRHAGGWSWIGRALGARKRYDYAREVGLGLDASVVMAPVQWLQRNLSVAPIVLDARDGEGKRVENHKMIALLEEPNKFYNGEHLLQATLFSLCLGGTGYWVKIRNQANRVIELWYAPHWLMKPQWPADGTVFISHYLYTPGGREIRLEPEDVVQFRMGVDPTNPRLGLAPLRSVLREVWADMEIGGFIAALLRNSGIPGVVISPDGPVAAQPNDVDQVKRYIRESFTGDKRGEPLVFSAKTKVERIGFNPQELDLTAASDRTEERVCALLGVPAVVVGFHAGSSQTSVGATMREQVKLGWHNGVIPLQSIIAKEVERSLLPDFDTNPDRLTCYFDNSEVEALGDEIDKIAARAERGLRGGAITVAEYREMLGMESDDTHNIYLRPFGVIEVPGDTGRAPVQEPGPMLLGADPRSRKLLKHSGHSGVEERIAREAPHAEAPEELERFTVELEAAGRRAAARFEKQLTVFFRELGELAADAAGPALEEAKARKKGKKNTALNLMVTDRVIEAMALPDKRRLFREHYERHFLGIAQDVANSLPSIVPGIGTDLPDRVGRAVIATGGRRAGLVDLEAQTRERILRAVADGRAEGSGVDEIVREIRDGVPAGPWSDARVRSRVIARSETKYAQNVSVLEHARANDVQRFMVFDGRLGETDEVCAALDGAIVTADEAQELVAAEHPNGTRSITPYFGS